MAATLSQLRNTGSRFNQLKAEADRMANGKKDYEDDRFWDVTRDKNGNGKAIVRFLPPLPTEEFPFIQVYSHGFKNQNTKRWLVENCPFTLNRQECPICDAVSALYDSGLDKDKAIASARRRKLRYISNVYIVEDIGNRANEGKVFLFSYGKKIFEKLDELMNPKFQGETSRNPFDIFGEDGGANFILKVRIEDDFPSYSLSSFDVPSRMREGEEEMLEIYNRAYSLQEFLSPSRFKSYQELEAIYAKFIGAIGPAHMKAGDVDLSNQPAALVDDKPKDVPVKGEVKQGQTPPLEAEVDAKSEKKKTPEEELAEMRKYLLN